MAAKHDGIAARNDAGKSAIHWGIFIPVLLLAFCVILISLLPFILVARLINVVGRMASQFNQHPALPGLNPMLLLVLVPDFVIVTGLLVGTWFTYLKSEVTLTDRRLVFRTGYLSRRSGEVPLENVESISFLNRFWGVCAVTGL